MKSLTAYLLLTFLAGAVFADVPRNPRPDRYKDLYLKSPITDPPEIEVGPPKVNDLPDWVLVGLSKYVDGVKVKLMNKKDRSRVTIPSEEATKLGFSIKEVKQDRNFIDEAVVTVRKNGIEGEVRFDPQFLVLKKVSGAPAKGAPPVPTPAASKGKTPTNNRPPIPGRSSSSPSNTPPVPGSVPRPSTSSSRSNTSTNGTSKPTRRPRYLPRKK